MLKTLRISFALKNTYRVNGILHSLKQIPLLKRVLPDRLYQVRGLKIFANVLSVLWEIVSIFLGSSSTFSPWSAAWGSSTSGRRRPRVPAHPAVPDADRLVYEHQPLQPHPGQVLRHDPSADERPVLHPGKLRLRAGEGRGGVPAIHRPLWPGPGRAAVAVPADPCLHRRREGGGGRRLPAGL